MSAPTATEYLLGIDGNQPFSINQAGVSHRHARLCIENGVGAGC